MIILVEDQNYYFKIPDDNWLVTPISIVLLGY